MFDMIWEKYTNDLTILSAIKGYKLEFENAMPPVQVVAPYPYKLRPEEVNAVKNEIQRLSHNKVIELAHDKDGFISNIFTRPKKDGGFRMILDLSILNDSISYYHFKMDTVETAISLISEGCFMTTIDLKDAYYSIPIAEEDRKYLKFIWQDNVYQFRALPNGLTSGPRLFTKLLKPPLSFLRKMGITVVAYIDDTLVISNTRKHSYLAVEKTTKILSELGFIIHPSKSVFTPTQEITFLGFILDSKMMQVRLPQSKKEEIKKICRTLLSRNQHTIQIVATALGKIVATFPAVQYGKLHYRELEINKTSALKYHRGCFSKMMTLSQFANQDVLWWLENVDKSYRPIKRWKENLTITSDASGLGWGATDGDSEIGGRWNPVEMCRAERNEINYLEMLAAFLALQSFCKTKNALHVRLRLDNTTAVAYINNMGGTKSLACNLMAKTIWNWCIAKNIWISAIYLPGRDNTIADQKSRKFNDNLEWMLAPNVFEQICSIFGTPDIDLFATRLNTQLKRYISWHPDPGAESCDAFSVDWQQYYVYAFPPFSLILRCLRKLELDSGEGIMIVPNWPTQPWFPLLLAMLVEEPLYLPNDQKLLQHPVFNEKHPLHNHISLLACRLSGNPLKALAFQDQHQTLSWQRGEQLLRNNTKATSKSGWHFVVNEKLVPCKPLLSTF